MTASTPTEFKTPQMIVDLQKCWGNIDRMADKMKQHGVAFRPHFKTHQCAAIGERFKHVGVTAITVSSLDMAAYFASHGWQDITLAVPVNLNQTDGINQLAKRVRLNLLVDSIQTTEALSDTLESTCPVWVKVDVGYGRAGIKWHDEQAVLDLFRLIKRSDRLDFAGLLTHSGHTYACRGQQQVTELFEEGRTRMVRLKQMLSDQGIAAPISLGDTPSASLADNFADVDEMRPGNFVFYDVLQSLIGSCQTQQIAVAIACPVIGKYPDEQKIIVHGGAVHLSKDSVTIDGQRLFGQLALPVQGGWQPVAITEAQVFSCCQEVTQIKATPEILEQIELGQAVYILPAHSCLAAEIYPRYTTTQGQDMPRFRLYAT